MLQYAPAFSQRDSYQIHTQKNSDVVSNFSFHKINFTRQSFTEFFLHFPRKNTFQLVPENNDVFVAVNLSNSFAVAAKYTTKESSEPAKNSELS
jgi:hypothetical protein